MFQAEGVCSQLGFPGVDRIYFGSYFGSIATEFSYDHLNCTGDEDYVSDCDYENFDEGKSGYFEQAGWPNLAKFCHFGKN